jgi:DivIVA domain-containing protein
MDDRTAAEAAIARIRGAKFRTTRWDGYDADEVDDFLDEMIAQLGRGESVAPGAPAFTRTRLRPGYRVAEVDALLQEFGI